MIKYRGAVIFWSYLRKEWVAVFGYGDHVTRPTRARAMEAVDARMNK
jgi:hypothetical protein